MSRVFIPTDGKWYSEVNLVSFLYESELEKRIIQHADDVFKEFYVLPFKLTLENRQGKTSKPDLIFIRKDYSEWWLVEVEKSGHSIGHVEEQIVVFNTAVINSTYITDYVITTAQNHNKTLDSNSVHNLVSTHRQKTMVIVDEPKESWKASLSKYKAKICIFQVYLSSDSTELYRIYGEYPYVFISHCHCIISRKLPNILTIDNQTLFSQFAHEDEFNVIDNFGRLSRWQKVVLRRNVYLTPVGRNTLLVERNYIIEKDSEGRFHIRLN